MRDSAIIARSGKLELDRKAECTSILNDIATSLDIIQGDWWHATSFGLKWSRRAKRTSRSASQLKQRCDQALKWILDLGRANWIKVETDFVNHGIKVTVRAEQANGQVVTFEKFVEVV